MFELRILGSPGLTRATSAGPEPCAIQPKRLALLAYLAIADRGRAHRRDTLTGLFWPELEQSKARGALRQALRYLRLTLGDHVIITRGNDEVMLADGTLDCDVVAFETALAKGELEAALSCYRGDLLAGLFITGASSEFEHWLDREVVRLRERAREAARTLSLHAAAEGDPARAAVWARRELEVSPYAEEPARRLIQLLSDAGQRADAVAAYQSFVQRLSSELELEPSPVLAALMEAIRSGANNAGGRSNDAPPDGIPPGEAPEAEVPAVSAPRAEAVPVPTLRSDNAPLVPEGSLSGISDHPVHEQNSQALHSWSQHRLREHRPVVPRWTAVVTTVAALLLLGGSLWSVRAGNDRDRVSRPLIASPFKVSASDASLHYLRDELPQLLTARLAPFTELVLDAPALRLRGEVLGTAGQLVVHASLLNGTDGRMLAVARVTGLAEELATLADRIVAQLIVLHVLGDAHRYGTLMEMPLPALRAYLDGRTALRMGRYHTATEGFQEALRHAPTCALAALGLASAGMHLPGMDIGPALTLAQAERAQLDALDQVFLDALAAQSTPQLEPLTQRLATWERVLQLAPDQAESWFWLGDILFHWGSALGIPDALQRAHSAFEHALELDPEYMAPITHLVDLAAMRRDEAWGWQFRLRRQDSLQGELGEYLDWRTAVLTGENTLLGPLRIRLGHIASPTLIRLLGVAQLDGIELDDAERAAQTFHSRGSIRNGNWFHTYLLRHYALNRGRPAEALRLTRLIRVMRPEGLLRWQLPVLDALFSDGDAAAAEKAALELSRLAIRLERTNAPQTTRARYGALCTAELWRLHQGERYGAPMTIATLRGMTPTTDAATASAASSSYQEPAATTTLRTGCATLLETLLATLDDPAASLAPLEELARQQHVGHLAWDSPHLLNLILARLYEERGDLHGALSVLRQRPYHVVHGIPYLSTFLHEEGRLAALTGDTVGAIRTYRHYLALRSAPEPALAEGVAEVRAALAQLEAMVR